MLDSAIHGFFSDKKEDWLKKKVKPSMETYEVDKLKAECEQVFSLVEWLPSAAKRAGKISLTTHPCTFSHPSARKNKNGDVNPVIADFKFTNDGFLKNGNVAVETDAVGWSGALDVHKFLTLELGDGKKLLSHIQQDTELAKSLLTISSASYQELKDGFIAMTEAKGEDITSSKIKQVYFPVSNDYHQLSLLTNSGLIYKLRARIDAIRFSEETKCQRELKRKNEFSSQGFSELYNLTTIGYGGTRPQNISVLNNQNGGKTHLLQSLPPSIEKRSIYFPKTNFFNESLRYQDYRDIFYALHKILKTDYNNINIREGRDYRLQELIDCIIDKMWAVRSVAKAQYHADSSQLKNHQKIWLCEEFSQEREESDMWLDKLSKEIASWTILTYEKILGKQAIKLGEAERLKIVEIISNNKEALR